MTKILRHSWKDIRDAIHGKILDTTYSLGDKLPKDEDIAQELGCARATVQRAMQDLSDSGIIERRRKGGTHVRIDPVTRATLEIPNIRIEVEQKGSVYGYQLVRKKTAETPLPVAAKFGLSVPATMMRIEALHLADQCPYIYEDRWVSTQTVPEFSSVNLEVESANEWLVRHRPYSRCDIQFFAINADEYLARLLDTKTGEALFVMNRTTWIGDNPITSVKSVSRPGYQLTTRI